MNKLLILICLFHSLTAMAENKLSVDLNIDKLEFQKPPKGVGRAGKLIFKTANVNNNGIVLNINNVNNLFDSQIFIRPTFLGFTTQFGDYGFSLDEKSMFNSINQSELTNSKLVLDDNQLNLSGESFSFLNADASLKLKTFRLYCQSLPQLESVSTEDTANDMMKNCFSFLTLNGSYAPNNLAANLEYEALDRALGDKTYLNADVRSFDLRKNQINADLVKAKSVSNNSYFINTGSLSLNCAKDEDLKEMDVDKIKKTCLNRIKISPLKANLEDKVAKSTFNLDIKDITVQDKILYFTMNSGALSDPASTTYLSNLLLNCRKETDTDLLELTQVLNDCITYSRLTIGEVRSTKPDEKDSSVKNIGVSSDNGKLIVQAEVKFIGIKAHVFIYGNVALNSAQKQLIMTVTDTKLPFGINSVKLLMYFLKKNLISKDVSITKNIITISL